MTGTLYKQKLLLKGHRGVVFKKSAFVNVVDSENKVESMVQLARADNKVLKL